MCNHISFRACNNELNDDVFCLLFAKSFGFQWAFKFKLFLHFLFYCLELRCSRVSNLASPYIWGQSCLPSE